MATSNIQSQYLNQYENHYLHYWVFNLSACWLDGRFPFGFFLRYLHSIFSTFFFHSVRTISKLIAIQFLHATSCLLVLRLTYLFKFEYISEFIELSFFPFHIYSSNEALSCLMSVFIFFYHDSFEHPFLVDYNVEIVLMSNKLFLLRIFFSTLDHHFQH